MRRSIITLCCFALFTPYLAAQNWSGINNIVQQSVFQLRGSDGETRWICSAVLINKDGVKKISAPLVLTAAHCVPGDPDKRSITVDGKHAEVVKWNQLLDLAVLKVEGLIGRTFTRRTEDNLIGMPVSAVGFALGADRPKYTFGWIADIEDKSIEANLLILDANLVSGQSGGALVDQSGRLITIVSRVYTTHVGVLGAGPSSKTIYEFAEEYWPSLTP